MYINNSIKYFLHSGYEQLNVTIWMNMSAIYIYIYGCVWKVLLQKAMDEFGKRLNFYKK